MSVSPPSYAAALLGGALACLAPRVATAQETPAVPGGESSPPASAAMAGETAPLDVVVDVPGATVLVDGREVATLPVNVPLGEHRVEVRRAGYTPYARAVTVDARGTQISVELDWARQIPPDQAAHVQVLVSEPQEVRALLDAHRIALDGSDAVPPGRHRLRVARPGYLVADGEVTLAAGQTTPVAINLAPDAATTSRRATIQRAAGWTVFGVGLAGAIGASVWLGLNESAFAPIEARYQQLNRCAPVPTAMADRDFCMVFYPTEAASAATARVSSAVLVGVGVAVAAAGLAIALTAPRTTGRERSTIQVVFGPGSAGLFAAF